MTDDRTAIVWQTLGAKPTRVRTQVADVARVILLYQKGLDPRSAGFCDLKADRCLIFCAYSLGFADQKSRAQSWGIAEKMIAKNAGNEVVKDPAAKPSVLRVDE